MDPLDRLAVYVSLSTLAAMMGQYVCGFFVPLDLVWSAGVSTVVALMVASVASYFKWYHRLERPALDSPWTRYARTLTAMWVAVLLLAAAVSHLYVLCQKQSAGEDSDKHAIRAFSVFFAAFSYINAVVGLRGEEVLPTWLRPGR